MPPERGRLGSGAIDPLVLAAGAVVCYGGPVVRRLGFYVDDWALIQQTSIIGGGLAHMTLAQLHGALLFRPTDVLGWTVPYWLFGARPLPWHLLAMFMTWLLGLTLFRILRKHAAPRPHALAAALLFMAFPNKDATLFWPCAALNISAALLLFLLAYLEHVRYLEGAGESALWLSAILLLLGLSTYEQAFFLLPIWIAAPDALRIDRRGRLRRSLKTAVATVSALALCKFVLTAHFVKYNKPVALSLRHAIFVAYMAIRAVADPRWMLYLLRLAWRDLSWHPFLVLAALALPAAVFFFVPNDEALPSIERSKPLLAWGAAVYVLGYLPFCFSDYAPAAYDHMNRLNQLPAVGIAAIACAWSCAAPRDRRRLAALAAAAAFALWTSTAFAEVWAESYRRQLAVRDAVLSQLEAWPRGEVLLLRLPELYAARKAPVFVADYDLSSAIQLWSGQPDRRAVVYSQWTKLGADALETPAGSVPYGSALLLDMTDGRIRTLDRRRARALPPLLEPWEQPLQLW